jgi:hypothetical protein
MPQASPTQFEGAGADSYGSIQRHRRGNTHALAIDKRAIGGIKVLNHPLVIPQHQAGVMCGGVVIANHQG